MKDPTHGQSSIRWRLVTRLIDHTVSLGFILLLAYTPFAAGSVHRRAFVLMETTIFLQTLLWLMKICVKTSLGETVSRKPQEWRQVIAIGIPVGALLMLICCQVVPLPMSLLQKISPETYDTYKVGIPTPRKYAAALDIERSNDGDESAESLSRRKVYGVSGWHPLSLARSVTTDDLLEAVSLSAVLFLTLLYRFERHSRIEQESRFLRVILITIVVTGLSVATAGLVKRGCPTARIWSSNILGGVSEPGKVIQPRANGPFVNPDHFANYLSMILPFAFVGSFGAYKRSPLRLSSLPLFAWFVASVLIGIAIALSLSRGAWLAAGVGISVTIALAAWTRSSSRTLVAQRATTRKVPLIIGSMIMFLVGAMYIIGPFGRMQVAQRLASTILNGSQEVRFDNWEDTTHMIAAFPIFGVGLGCWADAFPRFKRPPWSPYCFGNVENDYLQVCAEMGLVGLLLLFWFGYSVALRLYRGTNFVSPRSRGLYLGLMGSIAAATVHEAFDCGLHVPANALLFTILLAVSLRTALTAQPVSLERESSRKNQRVLWIRLGTAGAGIATIGLIVATTVQDGAAYPYGIGERVSLAKAEADVASHPSLASSHLVLAGLDTAIRRGKSFADQALVAVAFDPNDPQARDLYVRDLLLAGQESTALQQITLSIFHAPRLELHTYLNAATLPWLQPDEEAAIALGFERAVEAGFEPANDQYAEFCASLGRYRNTAVLYLRAAQKTRAPEQKINYQVKAGHYYGLAHDFQDAQGVLTAASQNEPNNSSPYVELIGSVLGPSNEFAAAEQVVHKGIQNGADPHVLEVALANAAAKQGNLVEYERALVDAVNQTHNIEDSLQLGEFYLAHNRLMSAISTLQAAINTTPSSARAFFDLACALRATYNYAPAQSAYARASLLAPKNNNYSQAYKDFERQWHENY
jgi:tetratricopeptide (TPR) repeat protein